MLQEATVNLRSSSATYGTLLGPAPERGAGLWHLIFHIDNGWLPVATGQPVRAVRLEEDSRKGNGKGFGDTGSGGSLSPPPDLSSLVAPVFSERCGTPGE